MVTEKQLLANRENAKKGGVKTEEGKGVVRHNALKHGLLAEQVLLSGGDEDAFKELRAGLVAESQPQGAIEMLLVDIMVSSYWRWRRAVMAETCCIEDKLGMYSRQYYKENYANTAQHGFGLSNAIPNLNRYETKHDMKGHSTWQNTSWKS